MCERNDTPAGESPAGNHLYAKFKKQLLESGFKSKCRKCNDREGTVLLQKMHVFCSDCLLEYCRHKFRSTIGKEKVLGASDRVLVAVSGGAASLAMVDMIRVGLEGKMIHKRPKYVTSVVHVDESILSSSEEPAQLSRDLFTFLCSSSDLDLYLTAIEGTVSKSQNSHHLLIAADDPASLEEKFTRTTEFLAEQRALFGSSFLSSFSRLQSATSKQDFVERLRTLELVRLARSIAFTRIFVGSTRTELATALLSDISLGRGIEVQSEMAFLDDRFAGSSPVTILRPCRELTAKELAFYVRLRGLDPAGTLAGSRHAFTTAKPTKSAIHRLTEAFLGGLAEEFPSTVYTVFNTGNKITSATSNTSSTSSTVDIEDLKKGEDLKVKKVKKEVERCRFCWAQIDTQFLRARNEYSAFEALQLTSALSVGEEEKKVEKLEDFKTSEFCYSCLRLGEEMGVEEFRSFCIVPR